MTTKKDLHQLRRQRLDNAMEVLADLHDQLTEPGERDAAAAAFSIYLFSPADNSQAFKRVMGVVAWSREQGEAFMAKHGAVLAGIAGVVRSESSAAGVTLRELVRLMELTNKRSMTLSSRKVAFKRELAELLSDDNPALEEVITLDELERLARKHGLTVGPDGHAALIEDSP